MLTQIKFRILVIDDDPNVGGLIKRLFETTGNYTVEARTDPFAAVATAQHFRPDLLFLDICMPGLDGVTLAEELRKIPALSDRPFIFFTGLPVAGRQTTPSLGPLTLFVNKGIRPSYLITIAEQMIKRAAPTVVQQTTPVEKSWGSAGEINNQPELSETAVGARGVAETELR